MKRYGSVIRVRPESLDAYKKYHAAVWPDVLAMIRRCNIRNYSIYLKDDLLFGYFEYHGTDYAADTAKMAADPKTQDWWAYYDADAEAPGNMCPRRVVGQYGRGFSLRLI